ncbi:MAG: serine protein kinase RIO [Desulfurococcaceae archaeon]
MRLDEIDRLIKEKTKYWEERIKDRDLFEVVDEVFDSFTLMTIIELHRRGVLRKINGVISSGKESRVYLGYDKLGNTVAIKIFLTTTAEFRKSIRKYIIGDPRFEQLKSRSLRSLILAWARKEYRNLTRMHEAGVKVPKPIACLNNVLVMEFLGENRVRYPLLIEVFKELTEEELYSIYKLVVAEVEKITCSAKLVHGDLSEYNIMVKPNLDIAIIDVSQAIDINHPSAFEFLKRDVENIYRFFTKEAKLEVGDLQAILNKVIPCLERKKAA